MNFNELFEQRSLVGIKLKNYIRDQGYTKISFASKANISRPTLDKLLAGSINNKTTFDRHLQKILGILNITVDDLMLYHNTSIKQVDAFYSKNNPKEYIMSERAKKEYDLLLDIVDLCSIYY